MKPVWAVGLMTGTIIDGYVDVALIKTDGAEIETLGPCALAPYSDDLRKILAAALSRALEWNFSGPEPLIFEDAERELTLAQSQTVKAILKEADLSPADIAVIGFHGQTVLHHAPSAGQTGKTRQLGDGPLMANTVGAPVAYDFRSADMTAGGHGAPVSAGYHAALLRHSDQAPNVAVLNLGGVANITWWGGDDDYVGFDSGPACGPLNDWVARHALGEMDMGGRLASAGKVDEIRLAKMIAHPFFQAPYPKSLDRYDFKEEMVEGLSAADGAATLTDFVGATIDKAFDLMPARPDRIILCGGGRKNPAIVDAIGRRAKVKTLIAEEVGWRGDAVEAECFAYLGMRVLRGLPITFPFTTGVAAPTAGGVVARPGDARRLVG